MSHTIPFLRKKISTSFWMKCGTTWVVTSKVTDAFLWVCFPSFIPPSPAQLALTGNCCICRLTPLYTRPALALLYWPLLLEDLGGPNYSTMGRSCLWSSVLSAFTWRESSHPFLIVSKGCTWTNVNSNTRALWGENEMFASRFNF